MDPTPNEIRDHSVNETKIGGDPVRAIALAIVYLADTIGSIDIDGLVDGVKQSAVELGGR